MNRPWVLGGALWTERPMRGGLGGETAECQAAKSCPSSAVACDAGYGLGTTLRRSRRFSKGLVCFHSPAWISGQWACYQFGFVFWIGPKTYIRKDRKIPSLSFRVKNTSD